ncbi:luciferase [Halobacteriales archaeon Cl-PHB]
MLTGATLAEADVDAAALKPTEMDVDRATELDVDAVTIDFEGRNHVPDADLLAALADSHEVRMTVPVRADGFDPLGDDDHLEGIPESVGRVLVAGHPAYLGDHEARRAVAPRLRAAAERTADPWVGTESVERLALAVGGTQFELLSDATLADVRGLRAAGFDGEVAVYAPTVLSADSDAILDAVGDYAARRPAVTASLPTDAPTDSSVTDDVRERLLAACRDYALVGDLATVRDRVGALREAGVDTVVGYPARGIDAVAE